MSILENVQEYIKTKYPCCKPVLRDDELLINKPHASISDARAYKAWRRLEDKLPQLFRDLRVERYGYQIHVKPIK